MTLESDRELAERLVRAAGGIALELRGGAAEVKAEGPTDLVTEADRRAEALLLDLLREERPGDGVAGEEGAAVAGAGARRWVLDPVDGTHNYARGVPLWCAAVALLDAEGPLACAIYDPERGELFSAARGEGAMLGDAPLRIAAGDAALGSASVAMFVDVRRRDPEAIAVNAEVAVRAGALRCLGCGSLELAYVAAGRLDAWLQPDSEPWDWHPGALLVREAGGVAEVRGRWYVASRSPALADELLALTATAAG
ncbi:MAG TPA: inositol monophosphatase [Solirubrobacteraceae bacterium]|jgi:fructose-1,6-bisphosphatase/inositol monophosphatase family enzyme|nr:inositol monophosphatase [Solirubrobacteraceae bacterium]